MVSLFRLFLLIYLASFFVCKIEAIQHIRDNPSLYLSDKEWKEAQDYLMPEDHPTKATLDQIFSNSRALADQKSMVAAGFDYAELESYTKIIVTRHPKLPGYIIKAYLDSTKKGPRDLPEQYYLIKRIIGARLVRESIQAHHYEHLLKVPEKFLYLLPDEPSPLKGSVHRMFILVEDDMNIYSERKNKKIWGSQQVTEELLTALYTVVTEVGLSDSTKPSNCPFSKDGKVALIDTQMYGKGFVKYENLTPFLSPPMQNYWNKLTQ